MSNVTRTTTRQKQIQQSNHQASAITQKAATELVEIPAHQHEVDNAKLTIALTLATKPARSKCSLKNQHFH